MYWKSYLRKLFDDNIFSSLRVGLLPSKFNPRHSFRLWLLFVNPFVTSVLLLLVCTRTICLYVGTKSAEQTTWHLTIWTTHASIIATMPLLSWWWCFGEKSRHGFLLNCLRHDLSSFFSVCGLLFVWCVETISRCGCCQTFQFCISQVKNQWDNGLLIGNHVLSVCPGLKRCLGHNLSPFPSVICSLLCGNQQQMLFSHTWVLPFTGPKPVRWLTSDGKSCHDFLS